MENSKKPSIRFKNFDDAWEQHKFNEEFDFMKNNSLSRAELSPENKGVMNIYVKVF